MKEEYYQTGAFRERNDFRSVLALRLRIVFKSMFEGAKNLVNVIMPEALGVMPFSFA